MAKREKRRRPPRARPLPEKPLTGCPGEVCRHVASQAIHLISRTLQSGKSAEPERAKDAINQERLDRWALGR